MPTSGLAHAKRTSMDIVRVSSFSQPCTSPNRNLWLLYFFPPLLKRFPWAPHHTDTWDKIKGFEKKKKKKSLQSCQLCICHMWLHVSESAESNASNQILLGWVWRWVWDAGFGQGQSSRTCRVAGADKRHISRGGYFYTKFNTDVVEPSGRRSCWSPAVGGIDFG